MTEFPGALLSIQITRMEQQVQRRQETEISLTSLLKEIPGIVPARPTPGARAMRITTTCSATTPSTSRGLPRRRFTTALRAEGISCSHGYGSLNRETFLSEGFLQPRLSTNLFAELKRWKIATSALKMIGFAPRRNGLPSRCFSASGATWNRSPRRSGKSRLTPPRLEKRKVTLGRHAIGSPGNDLL